MSDGILNIDGFNWSLVSYAPDYLATLPEDVQKERLRLEKETFELYHTRIKGWVEANGGAVWNTIGDCTIAHAFGNADDAVSAATTIQRRLTDFNSMENRLGTPLFVRIGVARGVLPDLPQEKRGEAAVGALNEAGHLQKDCPPGRVRISRAIFDALRFGKQDFRPALSLGLKALSKDSMVWVDRMLTPEDVQGSINLSPQQKRSYPPMMLNTAEMRRLGFKLGLGEVRTILPGSLVVIGESRASLPGGQPVTHTAATSDAVGVAEVLASLPSSTDVAVAIDEWVDTVDLAAQRDLLIVGSPTVNLFAYAVNRVLPAGFAEPNGGPIRIRIDAGSSQHLFPATYVHGGPDKHFGFVLLDRSPINPTRTLLWIAGITGMATQAAARLARDLVTTPKSVLDGLGVKHPSMIVVRPSWGAGFGPEHYQGMWRVSDYKIVWAGRQYEGVV